MFFGVTRASGGSGRVRRNAARGSRMVRREPQFGNQWMQRRHETGSIAPKPSGGSLSPLEAHADFLLALIADHPDLSLVEIVAAMRKRRIPGSRSAVWRFFERHYISFKKKPAGGGTERMDVARARRRWLREQGMFDLARLVFIVETSTNTAMLRYCPKVRRILTPWGGHEAARFHTRKRRDGRVAARSARTAACHAGGR